MLFVHFEAGKRTILLCPSGGEGSCFCGDGVSQSAALGYHISPLWGLGFSWGRGGTRPYLLLRRGAGDGFSMRGGGGGLFGGFGGEFDDGALEFLVAGGHQTVAHEARAVN